MCLEILVIGYCWVQGVSIVVNVVTAVGQAAGGHC